jgi:hypothetical protein
MNHFIDFDPYTIGQNNRQIRTEIDSLRLQELRKKRRLRRSSRLFALVKQMARSGDPSSPGHRLRTTSPDSYVQASLAGGGRRHGHRGK